MSLPEVTVIDYGVGNLLSVQRALEHCGARVITTADADAIRSAQRIVLPGVGAFRNAMQELHALGLVDAIREVAPRVPFLGICLGMQLLLDASEEFGTTLGLGLISGRVIPVPARTLTGEAQKIPHIGWSALDSQDGQSAWTGTLLDNIEPGQSVYFVHSFMASPADPSHRLADCVYGGHRIAAMISKGNIAGCQFHPEKSGEAGLRILSGFISQ